MESYSYHPSDMGLFVKKVLKWATSFSSCCCLNSNGYQDAYGHLDFFIAVGEKDHFRSDGTNTFSNLQRFIDRYPDTWIPGFLSYDLKNETEELHSDNPDYLLFPDAYFFVPEYTFLAGGNTIEIRADDPRMIVSVIEGIYYPDKEIVIDIDIRKRMSKDQYVASFSKLQEHIHRGDIYEINLCQEFYAEQAEIDPLRVYLKLNEVSPTPFSCFFKYGQQYILSASPERFLLKRGEELIAQPIKGTAARSTDPAKDLQLQDELRHNTKEIAENIMIVDLVRNDLTRSAKAGSVKATALLDVRSFKQVHQLVSTITCTIRPELVLTAAIKNTFPAGSMTGAPKIRAMQLIDLYENSRRGIYSGAVGYFGPDGDFDFNVIIRTILYNASNGYLSFHTGGAITSRANADQEYEECLIKAKAILEVLGKSITNHAFSD